MPLEDLMARKNKKAIAKEFGTFLRLYGRKAQKGCEPIEASTLKSRRPVAPVWDCRYRRRLLGGGERSDSGLTTSGEPPSGRLAGGESAI